MTFNFELSDDEVKQYRAWWKEHNKVCSIEEAGATGGRFTFSFAPTGLGTIVQVKCICGEELDLTDWESW